MSKESPVQLPMLYRIRDITTGCYALGSVPMRFTRRTGRYRVWIGAQALAAYLRLHKSLTANLIVEVYAAEQTTSFPAISWQEHLTGTAGSSSVNNGMIILHDVASDVEYDVLISQIAAIRPEQPSGTCILFTGGGVLSVRESLVQVRAALVSARC